MKRKGWSPSEHDMQSVVAIHNGVNERAWSEVQGCMTYLFIYIAVSKQAYMLSHQTQPCSPTQRIIFVLPLFTSLLKSSETMIHIRVGFVVSPS